MQLGMIGLGRMGGNIVRRLMKQGHTAVVYDKDPKAVETLVADGAVGARCASISRVAILDRACRRSMPRLRKHSARKVRICNSA